jgi:hypothetical protein
MSKGHEWAKRQNGSERMKLLESVDECVGKTVASASDTGSEVVIRFTDDTAMVVALDRGYYGDCDLAIEGDDDLHMNDKIRLELVSESEVAAWKKKEAEEKKERARQQKIAHENMERATYERLKKQFDAPTP